MSDVTNPDSPPDMLAGGGKFNPALASVNVPVDENPFSPNPPPNMENAPDPDATVPPPETLSDISSHSAMNPTPPVPESFAIDPKVTMTVEINGQTLTGVVTSWTRS